MLRNHHRGPYRQRWSRTDSSPLRDARMARDLTQQEAAGLLGINRSQLAGYEGGSRRLPRRGELANRIKAFIGEGPNTSE